MCCSAVHSCQVAWCARRWDGVGTMSAAAAVTAALRWALSYLPLPSPPARVCAVPAARKESVGEEYLQFLTAEGQWEEAARLCPRVLKVRGAGTAACKRPRCGSGAAPPAANTLG